MNPHIAHLRDFALAYPEAHEDFPWGELALKVRKKVFAFMHGGDTGYTLTVKLPVSHADALELHYAEPTGYGLGKSGWVTFRFEPGEQPPLAQLKAYLDESYRAVAPKTLVKTLPVRV